MVKKVFPVFQDIKKSRYCGIFFYVLMIVKND